MSKGNTGEVLGVHICGSAATELIHEAAVMTQMKGTVEELGRTIHAHPTLSEVVKEAALDSMGRAVHAFPKH